MLVARTTATATPNASVSTTAPNAGASGKYEGYLDAVNCPGVAGWAWNSTTPDDAVSVEIYFDNALVATVRADQLRPGLKQAGKSNGAHGFAYPTVPATLKDGKAHSVHAKIAGTAIQLRLSTATPGSVQDLSITC